jgi:hypothetical protein
VEGALQHFIHYVSWLTTAKGSTTVLTAQGYAVASGETRGTAEKLDEEEAEVEEELAA